MQNYDRIKITRPQSGFWSDMGEIFFNLSRYRAEEYYMTKEGSWRKIDGNEKGSGIKALKIKGNEIDQIMNTLNVFFIQETSS